MEPFETFQHVGMTCELHQDETPSAPSEWDNLGSLVAFDPLWNEYRFAERNSENDEDEAIRRGEGNAALLIRYLRMAHGMIAVPFYFADYGSSGAKIYETDTNPSGFIYTTHKRVNELCGENPEYHSVEWITNALSSELKVWNDWVEGNVIGYVVRDSEGGIVESVWGYYPDHSEKGDGFDYVRDEARAAAELEAKERERAANSDIATK